MSRGCDLARGTTLVELCAGTASLSLWALARLRPLVAFMGSKRRWADRLVAELGVVDPERVVLVDSGPWGDVWTVLRDPEHRARAALILDGWEGRDLAELWLELVSSPPPESDPAWRVAQYLWLQTRPTQGTALWWSCERQAWRSSRGGGEEQPARHSCCDPAKRTKSTFPHMSGMRHPSTIATRLRTLDALPWDRIEVLRADVRAVEPIPGAVVYHDPPYVGCPRYASLLPRADVLALARRWASAGCRVAVSEAVPLDELDGWHPWPLAPREWVTASWAPEAST